MQLATATLRVKATIATAITTATAIATTTRKTIGTGNMVEEDEDVAMALVMVAEVGMVEEAILRTIIMSPRRFA